METPKINCYNNGKKCKVLRNVKQMKQNAYERCSKEAASRGFDITFYKEQGHDRLFCKATPKNKLGLNNWLSRFVYGLMGKTGKAWVQSGDPLQLPNAIHQIKTEAVLSFIRRQK